MSDEDFLVYYDKEELDKFEKEEMKRYGLELGREEGREEGRKEGHEEGRNFERKVIIQNLLSKGMSRKEICEFIDIPLEEIDKLLD